MPNFKYSSPIIKHVVARIEQANRKMQPKVVIGLTADEWNTVKVSPYYLEVLTRTLEHPLIDPYNFKYQSLMIHFRIGNFDNEHRAKV